MQTIRHNLRILIADNHDIARWGLRDLLASQPGWQVCAEASTGRRAVVLAKQHRPDIVIVDIDLPDLNGIEAARIIRKLLPKTEVLIFSVQYSEQLLREILKAGVRAYVNKADDERDLVWAIEALANHRSFFNARAGQHLIEGFSAQRSLVEPGIPWHDPLTSREREVVQLIGEGKSTKEIALALGISAKTADAHRVSLMGKLDIHSVGGLVRYVVRNQMVEPWLRQPSKDLVMNLKKLDAQRSISVRGARRPYRAHRSQIEAA